MHQNTDWVKDFDSWYSKADISADKVELKEYISSLLQAREEWLFLQVKEMIKNHDEKFPEDVDYEAALYDVLLLLAPKK